MHFLINIYIDWQRWWASLFKRRHMSGIVSDYSVTLSAIVNGLRIWDGDLEFAIKNQGNSRSWQLWWENHVICAPKRCFWRIRGCFRVNSRCI